MVSESRDLTDTNGISIFCFNSVSTSTDVRSYMSFLSVEWT